MRPDDTEPGDAATLRRQAEEASRAQPALSNGSLSHDDALALVHELRVHQVELELQNEELERTRREAEALRDRYADLYDFAPAGYFTLDGAGVIRETNLAGAVQLGVDRESLVGARFAAFLASDSRSDFAAFLTRVLSGEATEACDVSFMARPAHGPYYAQLRGRADTVGAAGFLRLVVTDITERKRAEDALRETRDFLDSLINYANAPIIVWDPDHRIMRFNAEFEHLSGSASDEMIGRDLAVLFPEESREESLAKIQRTITERWQSVEIPILRLDGEVRIALWNSANIYGKDGKTLLATIAQGQDITERKLAEDALLETRDFLDSLINYANAPIIVWDPDHRITRFNAAFERLTGYAADEVIGRDLSLLFPAESREESLAKIQRTITEHWESVEIPVLRRDGGVRIALWNSANIYDPDGTSLLATIAQGQDITDRKEDELRIARYADELARSNEELQRFAYVASHDLQEPLRSIVSFSQLLERRYRGRLDADADDFIGFIVEGGNRMQRLIEDLLQLSRVETKAKPLAPTDTGEVVADVLRLMETPVREAGATVTVDDLPMAMADAAQLGQVFTNLVGNAIKYRRDGVPLEIRIASELTDGMWEFSVADNGIGIEAVYFDRIFEMFRRLHTKEEYAGTGIGLAVVKRIVERHGGTVRVESTPGEGSTFFFTLPAG